MSAIVMIVKPRNGISVKLRLSGTVNEISKYKIECLPYKKISYSFES
jgi:hypothetical protein